MDFLYSFLVCLHRHEIKAIYDPSLSLSNFLLVTGSGRLAWCWCWCWCRRKSMLLVLMRKISCSYLLLVNRHPMSNSGCFALWWRMTVISLLVVLGLSVHANYITMKNLVVMTYGLWFITSIINVLFIFANIIYWALSKFFVMAPASCSLHLTVIMLSYGL